MTGTGLELLRSLKAAAGGHGPGLVVAVGRPPVALLRPVGTGDGRLSVSDVSCLTEWRNANRDAFLTYFEASIDRTSAWLTRTVARDDSRILFMLDDLDGRPFGYMGLAQIDWDRRYGEADAIVRGRAEPHGVMGPALRHMLDWATSSLGLDRVAVRVRSDNSALGFYSRVGFRECRRIPLRWDRLREPPAYVEDGEAQTALALVHMEYSRGRSA